MSEPTPVSRARLALLLGGLGVLVIVAGLGALFIGSASVPPRDVLAVLTGRVRGVDQVVVLSLRLPRILAALLAGGDGVLLHLVPFELAGAEPGDRLERVVERLMQPLAAAGNGN